MISRNAHRPISFKMITITIDQTTSSTPPFCTIFKLYPNYCLSRHFIVRLEGGENKALEYVFYINLHDCTQMLLCQYLIHRTIWQSSLTAGGSHRPLQIKGTRFFTSCHIPTYNHFLFVVGHLQLSHDLHAPSSSCLLSKSTNGASATAGLNALITFH